MHSLEEDGALFGPCHKQHIMTMHGSKVCDDEYLHWPYTFEYGSHRNIMLVSLCTKQITNSRRSSTYLAFKSAFLDWLTSIRKLMTDFNLKFKRSVSYPMKYALPKNLKFPLMTAFPKKPWEELAMQNRSGVKSDQGCGQDRQRCLEI